MARKASHNQYLSPSHLTIVLMSGVTWPVTEDVTQGHFSGRMMYAVLEVVIDIKLHKLQSSNYFRIIEDITD